MPGVDRRQSHLEDSEVSSGATRGWTLVDFMLGARLLRLLDAGELSAQSTVREGLAAFGNIVALVGDSAAMTVRAAISRTFAWQEFIQQALMLASVSFLPTLLIAIPFGAVIVLEVGGLATQVGATSFTGSVDAVTTVREVAPVVTALVLSGAGGSAICSDLGSRTIRDEVAAMEVMGISPLERLVAPRLAAGVLVAVLLNGVVAFAGLLSAYATDVYIIGGSAGGYLNAFASFAQGADIIESTLKAAIFGFVTSVLACHKGLTTRRSAAGVGEAVNQSVVVSGLALFMLDLVITDIFFVLVPARIP